MIDALQRTIGSMCCAIVVTVAGGSDVQWAWGFTAGMLIGALILGKLDDRR